VPEELLVCRGLGVTYARSGRGIEEVSLEAGPGVLMLRYYRVPKKATCRITGHSLHLIEEHLALADKHFPTEEALAGYLANRGVELEVVG